MASVQMSGRGSRGGIVGINVTPFVDITLVLLIIMMVSSNYIVSETLKVELPKSKSGDAGVAKTAVVTIEKDGAIEFNQSKVSEEELKGRLRAESAKGEVNLVVSADKAVEHGRVVEVIDWARQANVTKFAINVDRRK